jgi:hypothetical protein
MEIIAPVRTRQHNLDPRPFTNHHCRQPSLVPQVDLTERELLRVGPKEKLNPLNQYGRAKSTTIDDDAELDKKLHRPECFVVGDRSVETHPGPREIVDHVQRQVGLKAATFAESF